MISTAPHPPIPRSGSIRPGALACLLVLMAATPTLAQAPPPDADWQTFETTHFRVTYTPELEPLARHAGDVAERTYAILRVELAEQPAGMIDLVVTDHVDYTNGFATPFPSNRIVVYARPPVAMPQLADSRDWIELVVAHELVHVFHLEESGRFGRVVRALFGRVPMIWPVFPVPGSPTWNVEGLATYYESRLTGAGRVHGSFHDMMVRTAVVEDEIPALDALSTPHPAWPGGQKSYGYGSLLMEHIAERYGPEAHRAIIEATGSSIRPTFLFFDHVAKKAVGEPFDALYEDWREVATRSARQVADGVRDRGITTTVPVAGKGPFSGAPRVAPDGRRLAFSAHDYRSDPATRIADLTTGRVRTLARRNQFGGILGPASWLPDGSGVVVAQLERHGPYRNFSDLWRVDMDGREHRLTRGQRIAQPDVDPDGRCVAAVRSSRGGLELVVHDLRTGETRVLAEAAPGEAFDGPRWSPGGDRIAVGRFAGGRVDVVVVDVGTGRLTPVTDDDALDLGPTWSPTGEWLLWWSDRTGIPNIMAARAPAVGAGAGAGGEDGAGDGVVARSTMPVVYQVSNLLTGGFDPEVSPDGGTLYLSVYHHDGWRIEGMALDPEGWTRAPESVARREPGLLRAPGSVGAARSAEPDSGASAYTPWPTLRPYFWFPEWTSLGGTGGELAFLGAYSRGRDLVSRHQWELGAAMDLATRRFQGGAAWVYRGLGTPDFRLFASRRWSSLGHLELSDGEEGIFRRTDRLGGDAFFWRARWRSMTWLRVGADAEWRELQGHDMTDAELRAEGWELRDLPTVVGVSGGPGYSSARYHPFSISAESGVSGSFGAGRWWDVKGGAHAYDELIGRLAGYLDFPAWGFADHVLAVRTAGLLRDGADAIPTGIGGVPGGSASLPAGAEGLLSGAFSGPAFLPVRGFDDGARAGTRAWTVNGEWRFPIRMSNAPGRILGFSLTAVSGTLFADAGDAWCPPRPDAELLGCSPADLGPLVSAGGELSVDFGLFHNSGARLRLGLAQPLQGPGDLEPVWYLSLGPSF